jgi:hypothetical protein
MPGWDLVEREPNAAFWRDASGDVVSLTLSLEQQRVLESSDANALQAYCRQVAEDQGAGLVEVELATSAQGPAFRYIYKRLVKPAFTFFGVVDIPRERGHWVWMVVAKERGTTGIREALITAYLANNGRLTIESFKASWAQDPYDSSYRGVDRSTLRYESDAAEYDELVPDHPLSKTRRELRRLLSVQVEEARRCPTS